VILVGMKFKNFFYLWRKQIFTFPQICRLYEHETVFTGAGFDVGFRKNQIPSKAVRRGCVPRQIPAA